MNLPLSFFKKYYLPCFIVIAITIYTAQKTGWILPTVINNYANDFLLLPIVFGIIKHVISFIIKDPNFKLPLALCIVITLFYIFLFEIIAPLFLERYTADIVDVIVYIVGLLFFLKIENYLAQSG